MDRTPPSFAEIVRRHHGEILGYLARLLGDRHEAEDAFQETLMRAHRSFARLAPDSNPRAWLYRIATHRAWSARRSRRRRGGSGAALDPDHLPATATGAERSEDLRRILRAVDRLPDRQRAALVLRRFHDMSYAEIASSLGGTEAAARANVYQAVRNLRRFFEGGLHEPKR